MTESDNEQAAYGGEDIWLKFQQYWDAMFKACYRILRDKTEAEDATGEAILKALGNLPKTFDKDPRFWLCTVARNVAFDRRRKIKEEQEFTRTAHVEARDPLRVSQIQLDTRKLLERVMGLVDESLHDDVGLYFDVLFGNFTEQQLADLARVERDIIKGRRRRARAAVRDAAAVVCLTTDPGAGKNRCVVPFSLARNRKDSPELLATVLTHVRGCTRCQCRWKEREPLLRAILAIPGLALAGSALDRLLRTSTQTKLAAATSVAAVAAVILVPGPTGPGQDHAVPPAPSTERAVPVQQAPTSPQRTAPPTPTVEPPVVPTVAPQPAPAPTDAAPPAPGGGARVDSPPVITDSWVEHRRIVAADDGTCGDEPTSSVVGVTASPGVTSAVLHLTAYGHTVELRMRGTGDGSTWDRRVGPVPNEYARGTVALAVRIIGANGASSVKRLGEICIRPCRHGH